MKKIRCGLITSGGDAPGMNKIIYDLCYLFQEETNVEIVLIKDGLKGLYEKSIFDGSISLLQNLAFQQSSIIGTSRFSKFTNPEIREKVKWNLKELNLDKLIIIGGDGSFEASKLLMNDINIIFIPATIDNDFPGGHLTLGYYSCLEFISKTIFNLSLSAKAHQNVYMIELMGNKSSELIVNSSKVLNNVLYINDFGLFNEVFKKRMFEKYQKEKYLIILIKEKIMSELQKANLEEQISLLLDNKVRTTILGYTQRSCDVSLNDLIYASTVAKYIKKNINSLNNCIVSYSAKEPNEIKTSIIKTS